MSTSAARAVQPTAPLTIILPQVLEPVVDRLRADNPTASIRIAKPQLMRYTGRFRIIIIGAALKLSLGALTSSTGLDLVDLEANRPNAEAVLTYDLIEA